MTSPITATMILDSVNPDGCRISTIAVVMPKFLVAQLNTHRKFCLAGDSVLDFDLPSAKQKGCKQLHQMTIADFVDKWLEGNKHISERLSKMSIRQLNEVTGEIQHSTVNNVTRSGVKPVYTLKAGKYTVSGSLDHLIKTEDGYTRIGDLKVGDTIVVATRLKQDKGVPIASTLVEVTSIEYRGEEMTYDLEIAGEFPNFLANGVVVHNSRNSASSRAITIAKNIGYVLNSPVTPADYGMPANGSGMQPKAALSPFKKVLAKALWNGAKYSAITFAYLLSKVGLHKQWVNRLLEPFVYTTVLITSTEWHNFLTLRMHGAAQDAMQHVAYHINRALISSTPVRLEWGGWHLPYVGQFIKDDPTESQQNVSVSCCAQVSFRSNDYSVEKAERVIKTLSGEPPHASPFEHAAQAVYKAQYGNLDEGWVSLRYSRFGY